MDDHENMAVLTIGYGNDVVLPVEAACEIVKLLTHARKYQTHYVNNRCSSHVGGELPSVSVSVISAGQYAEGLINGVYEEKQHEPPF